MDDDSLLDELQEDLGSDYSPQLRVAAGMLSGDAQAVLSQCRKAMDRHSGRRREYIMLSVLTLQTSRD